jgi:GWxTD domain-containing protein
VRLRSRAPASVAAAVALFLCSHAAVAAEDPRQARKEERDALATGDIDTPTLVWREGPVRYILGAEEDHAYRRLTTREERAAFIRRFWQSRDPDPSTPQNEYRDLFGKRVAAATRLFTTESTKPGWKTDRGKIYILLGPPDDLDETILAQRDTPLITWTYRNPPPGTVASPNTQVRFVRDASGEYRLTTALRLFASESAMSAALALQALQVESQNETRMILDRIAAGRASVTAGGTAEGAAGGAEHEGGPAAGPGSPAAPEGGAAADPTAFVSRAEAYPAGGGLALVILTAWVPESLFPVPAGQSPPGVEVAARLAATDGSGRTYDLAGAGSLRPGTGDLGGAAGDRRMFQGGTLVRPGRYGVYYVVVRHGDPDVRSFRDTLDVAAAPAPRLAVGPVRLAARLDHLPERAGPDYVAPFVLGRLRIVPRLDTALGPQDELAFYYQVLGAALDPIEGLPDFDVEYRVLSDAGGAEGPRPFGQPIQMTHEQAFFQGFSLPVTGWRAGAYRVRVTVTDKLTGSTATGETAFRIR